VRQLLTSAVQTVTVSTRSADIDANALLVLPLMRTSRRATVCLLSRCFMSSRGGGGGGRLAMYYKVK